MNSIDFLRKFHPDRPWILTAIEPSQKGIETRAFPPGQEGEAKAWIKANDGKRNLYFSVAEVLTAEDKKASLDNVKAVHWFHVDIDAGPGDLLKELDRIKRLVTTDLPQGALKPTVVLYSGGGYQAFWKLTEPILIEGDPTLAKEAARYNKQIELLFGGDTCHNVDRIMRLPGTMNIPNQRKVAKGRVPVQAKVEYFDDDAYELPSFSQATDVGRIDEAGEELQISGNVQRLTSVDDLDQWDVPDRVKVIVVQGDDPDEPEKHPSRSEWLFDCVCNLVRAEVPDETIYSVLTDPGFKIASSVLETSNPDRYARKQIRSAKEVAVSENLHMLNKKHAVIGNLGGKCLVVEEVFDEGMKRDRLVKQTFGAFRERYLNKFETITVGEKTKLVPIGDWWLRHPKRREFDRLVFQPGREIPGTYNLWQGFGCNALPGTAHESFLKHLHSTVCQGVDEHYAYLIGWLARTVQHPDQPGHTAIVMRGRQGTGKSFFAKHFGHLFGRHFLHVSNAAHLVGNFNGHLRDAVVVFGDEAFYAGDKRHESVLKTLITEESLVIETKGVDAEASPNYCHLILASNSNWVVPVGSGDRRYFVIDVGEQFTQDTKHFGEIAADLEKRGGYENLLHYLMHFDLTDYNVQAIPATDARTDQHEESLEPHEDWWLTVLEDGILGGEIWKLDEALTAPNDAVLEQYRLYVQDVSAHRKLSPSGLGRYFARILDGEWPTQKKVRIDGRPTNARVFPALDEARSNWDRITGSKRKWRDVSLTPPDDDLPF